MLENSFQKHITLTRETKTCSSIEDGSLKTDENELFIYLIKFFLG